LTDRIVGSQGIDVVAFDGDDTLWHSEHLFVDAQAQLAAVLAPYVAADVLYERLAATERANLALFGYGVKGFTLSLIETAIELSDGEIPSRDIGTILDIGKAMLDHPVELLDGALEAVEALAGDHRLVLVTKGDLVHQESKIARSGLADRFDIIEIVADKDAATYRRIVSASGTTPERFVMVGNSLRSEIVPVLDIGGHAIHVPYEHEAVHERIDDAAALRGRYHEVTSLREVPAVVTAIEADRTIR
jgi:putative hydrolase of the HAD superfamily